MRERVPIGPYGPPAQSPDGVLWGKLPDDLWGEVSKSVQLALRALLKLWNGLTVCEPTREELREAINELRRQKNEARAKLDPPLPPLRMIGNKRTISWYFAKLKELKIIERGRVEGKKTDWYTKFTRPFYAKLDEPKPVVQVGKPVPSGPQAVPSEPYVIDLGYGPWAIEQYRKHGWLLVIDSAGKLDRFPIEDVDQDEPTRDVKAAVKKHMASILAFLKQPEPHQRE